MQSFPLGEIKNIASEIITRAQNNFSIDHATLVTFSGDLGAGKTTLIQTIAELLGVTDQLTSPTFVIYKKYSLEESKGPWTTLVHGDMYRLESENEITHLGWEDLLKDSRNIICIEWPEKIQSLIPDWAITITLGHQDDAFRTIDIQ